MIFPVAEVRDISFKFDTESDTITSLVSLLFLITTFCYRLMSQSSSKDPESLGLSHEDAELQFHHDSLSDISNYFDVSGNDGTHTLLDTLKAGEVEVDVEGDKKDIIKSEQNSKAKNCKENEKAKLKTHQDLKNTLDETSEAKDVPRERSSSANSEFDNIVIEKDLKCKARGCACEKEKRPLNKNDCGTNNNGAKVRNESVKVAQCNTGTETNDRNVFNVDIRKEVCDTGNLVIDISEELSENNADLTPVMTDSNSTLCDQFSVIPEGDNHSSAENNGSIKDIAKSYSTNMANISNIDESTSKKKANENKIEPVNDGTLHVQADKGQSKKDTEMPEDAGQTVNENKIKDIDKEKATGQLGISSDSSVDIDNIQKKETGLDFEGVGENQADLEVTRKNDEEHAYLDFGNSHHKHGHSIQAFGTADKEKTSGMDASKKRKWKFMHPFKNILDGEASISK